MAYMSQEKKAKIAPEVKRILKKYNLKGSLGVRNHMVLVLNIKQGDIDFISNYNKQITIRAEQRGDKPNLATKEISINPHWYHEHFTGKAKTALTEIVTAMMDGNHDNSDSQSDYFDVGWYIDVNIGQWDKPYALVK